MTVTHLLRNQHVEAELEAAVRLDPRGVETISTLDVQPQLRNAVWEARNRSHLVGLKAGSPSPSGLVGTMRSAVVNGLSIADITGNAHTVERTLAMSKQLPIESVMFTFVLKGESFHYNGRSTMLVKEGEVAIYDSDNPFLLGFSESMHAIVASLPRYHLADVGMQDAFRSTRVMRHAGRGVESQMARKLLGVLQGAFERPVGVDAHEYNERFVEQALRVVQELNPRLRHAQDDYFEEARSYIERRLGDPTLSIADVAEALSLSQRHLGRIFAAHETTVGQEIQEQRLQQARAMLTAPEARTLTAAEIALRSGFTSPSHFSRVFRARFGMTPTEARRRESQLQTPPVR